MPQLRGNERTLGLNRIPRGLLWVEVSRKGNRRAILKLFGPVVKGKILCWCGPSDLRVVEGACAIQNSMLFTLHCWLGEFSFHKFFIMEHRHLYPWTTICPLLFHGIKGKNLHMSRDRKSTKNAHIDIHV